MAPSLPCDAANKADLALARAVADGAEASFDQFYSRFGGKLYTLARRFCGESALAEDMTQEVFLHLMRKIRLYNGQAALATWIHRVAVNFYISYLRGRHFERQALELDGLPESPSPPAGDVAESDLHRRMDIEQGLAALPFGYRRVLILHDIEGYAHQEIAKLLKISEGTSKSQLHCARMKLRVLLQRGGI